MPLRIGPPAVNGPTEENFTFELERLFTAVEAAALSDARPFNWSEDAFSSFYLSEGTYGGFVLPPLSLRFIFPESDDSSPPGYATGEAGFCDLRSSVRALKS